jgi:hypothetical protein
LALHGIRFHRNVCAKIGGPFTAQRGNRGELLPRTIPGHPLLVMMNDQQKRMTNMSESDPPPYLNTRKYMTRRQLAEYLQSLGYPVTRHALNLACAPSRNEGPEPVAYWGTKVPLYDPEAGVRWAEARLRPPPSLKARMHPPKNVPSTGNPRSGALSDNASQASPARDDHGDDSHARATQRSRRSQNSRRA